jgi:excisionase family DNA binding protein
MREGDAEMDKMLLTKEVAEILRVSEEYVRELIRREKICAYKEGRRGGYRITPTEVEKYISEKYSAVGQKDFKI